MSKGFGDLRVVLSRVPEVTTSEEEGGVADKLINDQQGMGETQEKNTTQLKKKGKNHRLSIPGGKTDGP